MISLADARSELVPTPAGRIHVAVVGDGPPLALVHGWPQDHRAWRDAVPLLAPRYRLILPDLRGFGRSDAPRGPYLKAALADDLLAVFDHLGIDRLGLVGHDWGGWVGFLLALDHPERFAGFVACNIAHPWTRIPPDPRRVLPFAYMPVVATPFLGPLLLRRTSLVRGLIRGGTARGNRLDDHAIDGFARMIAEPERARASSALYRSFLVRELPGLARAFRRRRLRVPVRVVFGRRDPAIHPSLVDGLAHHADHVDHVWIDDAGHFVAEERPEPVARAIDAFFTDRLRRPPATP